MSKFSERIGIVKPPKNLQLDSMNNELKNSFWNLLYGMYADSKKSYWFRVAECVAQYFRKVPVDDLPDSDYACMEWLKQYFYSLNWHQTYDFLEFIVEHHIFMTREYFGYVGTYHYHRVSQDKLVERINLILEREFSGFRFISRILTPISDKTEVAEIETAIDATKNANFQGAHEHIKTSLGLLGKKPAPDYRNSIKEAISAVESIVKQISGSSARGLSDALAELSKNTDIHGSLKSGFEKLYGYSSDESGIRHAILDQPNVGFAEAKYMIVACSAFVNYLIAKAEVAGLLHE